MSQSDLLADEGDIAVEEFSIDLLKGTGFLAARIIVTKFSDKAGGGVGGEELIDTFKILTGLQDGSKDCLKLFDLESWVTLAPAALWLAVMVVVTLLVAGFAALSLGNSRSDEQQGNGSENFH